MTDLHIHLEPEMLENARSGRFNFMNVVAEAARSIGWQVRFVPDTPAAHDNWHRQTGHALFHMRPAPDGRALTFRRAYHYPFWQIEPVAQRWRFHVAQSRFDPASVPEAAAQEFLARLRARVLPGPPPRTGETVLIPLQGRISEWRSFQALRPLDMVQAVARTGRPAVVTLHPNEVYHDHELQALHDLSRTHANLTIGGETAPILRDCAFVVTQNSAVAFDGLILGKPAVLFGQSDFHHIALNVAQIGAEKALAQASTHRPDFARYIFWFLRRMAVNATAPDARMQVLRAMKRGGWPIDLPPSDPD